MVVLNLLIRKLLTSKRIKNLFQTINEQEKNAINNFVYQ